MSAVNAGQGRRLGELLTSLRNLAGMTQEELAGVSGLSARSISDLERGRVARPRRRSLELLAAALDLDPAQAKALIAIARGAPARWPDRAASGTPGTTEHKPLQLTVTPRQLPGVTSGFVGRSAGLATLSEWLGSAARADQPVTIVTIAGAAGVGKTTLAIRWGHQVAEHFPDGQLWLNLRGFTPAATPLSPAEAIRALLDALHVPPDQIPVTLDAQAGMYRSLLAGRRVLVVLDNARDTGQVRPLLPGSPGCLVVVTSRDKLVGLAATNGARLLHLKLLSAAEARQLLEGRLGRNRLAAEPDAADELIRLCAGLPLALGITAARASATPNLRLADLAVQLRDTQTRLDVLDGGDAPSSLRAVYFCSYRQLSPETARLFRLLGLHPGPDISAAAAASLAARPLRQVHQALTRLTEAHLLTEQAPGRYTCHDLLRVYAQELAHTTGSEPGREAAIGRMLDHYLHTAHSATVVLRPSREPITPAPPRPGVTPEQPAGDQHAIAWFEAEHHVLLAAVALAASTGFDVHAWQIPWAMADFLDWRGYWHQQVAVQHIAVAAAARLGDTGGHAEARRLLAKPYTRLGDYDQARAHHAACLELYQQTGDRAGQARAHQSLAWANERQGRLGDALGHAGQAHRLYEAIGHQAGQARSLNNIGYCHAQLGHYQQAQSCCEQALSLWRQVGDRNGEAATWDSLGYAEHHLGHHAQALSCYQHALRIFRELGDRYYEAATLTHLGDTRHASAELQLAREAWQQALAILDDLRHPDASQVRAKLASTDKPGPLESAARPEQHTGERG